METGVTKKVENATPKRNEGNKSEKENQLA